MQTIRTVLHNFHKAVQPIKNINVFLHNLRPSSTSGPLGSINNKPLVKKNRPKEALFTIFDFVNCVTEAINGTY